jgi:hypothetical protein
MTRNQDNKLELGKREIAIILVILSLLGIDTGATFFTPSKVEEKIESIQNDIVDMKVSLQEVKTELRMRAE